MAWFQQLFVFLTIPFGVVKGTPTWWTLGKCGLQLHIEEAREKVGPLSCGADVDYRTLFAQKMGALQKYYIFLCQLKAPHNGFRDPVFE